MIRLEGVITYADGREERIEVTQAAYAAYELWAMRQGLDPQPDKALPMTMQRYLGYQASQRKAHLTRDSWRSYDDWDLDVLDVTLDVPEGVDEAEVNPTLQIRSVE